MKHYGILGYNIAYSLSPAMHKAAFKKLKLKASYKIFDIKPNDLNQFLGRLLRSGINGLNVTVPYKRKAYDFVAKFGTIDKKARALGVINTIAVKNKSIYGYNTDALGFIKSLEKDLKFKPKNKNVIIFGAGGAGRACAGSLSRSADNIYIFDIDIKKLKEFEKVFPKRFGKSKIKLVKKDASNLHKAIKESSLLVNATPFGMKKKELLVNPNFLHRKLKILDLIYCVDKTPIMKMAHKIGIEAVNGLGMLLYQGMASFEIWTGRSAPMTVMKNALIRAIRK